MKREIEIDGIKYVQKEESSKEENKFKAGDWIKKTWKDGSKEIDIFRIGENIQDLNFEMNHYIRTKADGSVDDLSKEQDSYTINMNEPRWTLSKLNPSEISTHLIAEAKRRGYKKGITVKSCVDNEVRVIEFKDFTYLEESDTFHDTVCSLYEKGMWSEIIKDETIKIGGYEVEFEKGSIKVGCKETTNANVKNLYKLFDFLFQADLTGISIRENKVNIYGELSDVDIDISKELLGKIVNKLQD